MNSFDSLIQDRRNGEIKMGRAICLILMGLVSVGAGCSAEKATEPASAFVKTAATGLGVYHVTGAQADARDYFASEERLVLREWIDAAEEHFEIVATENSIERLASYGVIRSYSTRLRDFRTRSGGARNVGPCSTVPDRTNSELVWSYDQIREFIKGLPLTAPTLIDEDFIGKSIENRPIVAVRFGVKRTWVEPPVPTVYVIATQHAQEWGAAGTALGVIKELALASADRNYRPSLFDALQHAAIVVVPVANPDGYEFGRNNINERDWRGNRNLQSCSGGVNLNRNHPGTWGVAATHSSGACNTNYIGSGSGSEPEVQAIQTLLGGLPFSSPSTPVVLLDYHTYGDLVVYPSGYKASTDADGPACDFRRNNCHGADFQAMREVFGDTTSHRFVPPLFWGDEKAHPFARDQAPNIIYSTSGTMIDDAMYTTSGRRRVLSATIELSPSATLGHFIECDPDFDKNIAQVVVRQLDTLERMIGIAPQLDEATSSAYLPSHIGVLAAGYYLRDYSANETEAEIRPQFRKPGWLALTKGRSIEVTMSGQSMPLGRLRVAAEYELFSVDPSILGADPLCPPCEVETMLTGSDFRSLDVVQNCGGSCLDLCDPRRVVSYAGWELVSGDRGGRPDCWWSPTTVGGELHLALLRQIAWLPQSAKREVPADEAGDERALGLS